MKSRYLYAALFLLILSACKPSIVKEVVQAYPDGSPKIVRFFKEADRNKTLVKEILYHPNHQKYMEGEYKNNKRDGLWTSWYQNGNKWSEGIFKEGLDDGYRYIFHENGKKQIEGNYKDGKKVGVWKFYDDKGNFIKEENFSQ